MPVLCKQSSVDDDEAWVRLRSLFFCLHHSNDDDWRAQFFTHNMHGQYPTELVCRPEKRPLICVVKSQLSAVVNTYNIRFSLDSCLYFIYSSAHESHLLLLLCCDGDFAGFLVCALQHWLDNIVITMRACLSFECLALCESEKCNLLVEIAMKSLLIIYTWDARAGIVVDSDRKKFILPSLTERNVSTHTWVFNSAAKTQKFDSCHMAFCRLI